MRRIVSAPWARACARASEFRDGARGREKKREERNTHLEELVLVDDEVLAEHGRAVGGAAGGLGRAARRQQVGEGALEVDGLGQHRHDGRADAGVLDSLRECGSE